ncbi:hypothetical protein BH10BDE1_BH10BDE1_30120 [soil metagenome]
MTTSTQNLRIHVFSILILASFAILGVMSPCVSYGQNSDSFSEGVAAFKAGQLDSARKTFLELEAKYPHDPTLLLNLGLIANKEKRLGAALALWRKGLAEHPTNAALLNAVDWVKPKLAKSDMARDFDAWEEWRRVLLLRVSPIITVVVSAIFFVIAGWLLLRWFGARRRALEEELALPRAPVAGAIMTLLFLFLFGISIAIFIDRLDIRGTIVVAKAPVYSAPDATATALFDVFEGMELVVRDTRKVGDESWRRVTYPGGNTGWIRDREVLTAADPSERAFVAKPEAKSGDGA